MLCIYTGGDYYIDNNEKNCKDDKGDKNIQWYSMRFKTRDECEKVLTYQREFMKQGIFKSVNLEEFINLLPLPESYIESIYDKWDGFALPFIKFYESPVKHANVFVEIRNSYYFNIHPVFEKFLIDNEISNTKIHDKEFYVDIYEKSDAIVRILTPRGNFIDGINPANDFIGIINKSIESSYKYIVIKTCLFFEKGPTHANFLVIDLENNVIYRIEPQMVASYKKFDEFMEKIVINTGFKYLPLVQHININDFDKYGQSDLRLPMCATYSLILTILCIKHDFNIDTIKKITSGLDNKIFVMILLYYISTIIKISDKPNLESFLKYKDTIPGYNTIVCILSNKDAIELYSKYSEKLNLFEHENEQLKKQFEDNEANKILKSFICYEDDIIDMYKTCSGISKNSANLKNYLEGYNTNNNFTYDYVKLSFNTKKIAYPGDDVVSNYYKKVNEIAVKMKKIKYDIDLIYHKLTPYFKEVNEYIFSIDENECGNTSGINEDCFNIIKQNINLINSLTMKNFNESDVSLYHYQVMGNIKNYKDIQLKKLIEVFDKYNKYDISDFVDDLLFITCCTKSGLRIKDIIVFLKVVDVQKITKYQRDTSGFYPRSEEWFNEIFVKNITNHDIINYNKSLWKIADTCKGVALKNIEGLCVLI